MTGRCWGPSGSDPPASVPPRTAPLAAAGPLPVLPAPRPAPAGAQTGGGGEGGGRGEEEAEV